MKKIGFIHGIFIVTTFCLLISCKESFSPTLREADKILFEDIERGEGMLDSIYNANPNLSAADNKYYQLLKLKADDKFYRPIDDQKEHIDSLVSYFTDAGDDGILAEAYFYAGRVYYEIGDKPEALKFYQQAAEKVAKDNYAMQGDIYSQMANVYSYTDLNKEALAALCLAYKVDSLAGNARNMLYDIRDMGEKYFHCEDYEHAVALFSKGLSLSYKCHDSFMQGSFHHELANIYEGKRQFDKALFHINQYMPHLQDYPDKSGMLVTALEAFTYKGDKTSMEKCRHLILEEGNVFSKQYAAENMLTTSGHAFKDSIFTLRLDLYIQYTDSVIKESHAESVKKVEKSYNYKLKEEENEYLQTSNFFKSIEIAIAAMLFLFCCVYFHLKMKTIKQKQKILELKVDKYKLLKEKNEIKSLDKQTREETEVRNSDIYKQLMMAIDKQEYHLAEEDWEEIQKLVNRAYENFDSNLRGFLDVTPQEYKICLLIKMKISPTNIARFVNLTKEAITASRRRMYTKAFGKKGRPSDWDNIIKSL